MKHTGFIHALGAFIIWGLFPLFWNLLKYLSPWEILSQRFLWSGLSFLIVALITLKKSQITQLLKKWKQNRIYFLSGTLLGLNWFIFIYLIVNNSVLQISLAYFLNPLMNVFFGLLLFKERLNRMQWIAVSMAILAMLLMGIRAINFPWLSIVLGGTFAVYGVIRKQGNYSTIMGASIEGLWLVIIAVPVLIFYYNKQIQEPVIAHFFNNSNWALFITGGFLTVIPVLLFTSAARRLPLSSVGVMQYIAPSMHFVIAIFVFNEPFSWIQLQSYILVWLGLGFYTYDLLNKI